MANAQRTIPAPPTNPETKAFWDGAVQGKLLIKKCRACGQSHYYPRALCPFCLSDATEWQPTAGTGTLYSFSVMRRAEVPYAIAYVTLDEGPTMMTNLVDCDFDALRIGQRVKLVFTPTEGGPPVPTFTPA
ncbi:MAG TPA: Zn-ribbon domain-containing OB-fold protein [Methylomirabilota bacterium]|jgi:hypothetical protein|nr:Zn-ribbon domain-containing OB-fold protein [Methylomirabilota bacterium]